MSKSSDAMARQSAGAKGSARAEPATGRTYRKVRSLNTDLLSMSYNPLLRVRIEGELRQGHFPTLARNADKTIPVVMVTNLETGEIATLLVPAVLASILDQVGDYVGRCYEITRGEIEPGKNYRNIQVDEIEPD